MAKLRVRVKGYRRKSFVKDVKRGPGVRLRRIKPTRVRGHIKLVPDIGRRGRGPRILPRLKKGGLGFSLKGRSQTQINRDALAHARKVGERRAAGQLRALQVLTKRTNPQLSRKAAIAAKHVYKSIGEYRGD